MVVRELDQILMFTTIVNILFGAKYTDVLVGFRAFRKSTAKKLYMDAPGLSWPCQSSIRFAQHNYKISEIAADEPERIGGVRKMSPHKTGWEIVKLIIREFFFGKKIVKQKMLEKGQIHVTL